MKRPIVSVVVQIPKRVVGELAAALALLKAVPPLKAVSSGVPSLPSQPSLGV